MMKEREIQDQHNTQWRCVQVFSGLNGKAAEKAAEKASSEDGSIQVVCTPSGGQQSVRLKLPIGWQDNLSDDDLVIAIEQAKE